MVSPLVETKQGFILQRCSAQQPANLEVACGQVWTGDFVCADVSRTTISIYTGRARAFRVPPGDKLKVVLRDSLDAAEELSYATTGERTYHAEVPVDIPVGRKDWTVSCISNLPVEQALIRLEEKLDSELTVVNDKLRVVTDELRDLRHDSLLWATLYLRNVASEALLFAYGDQPQPEHQGHSHRFLNLANNNDNKLATYASTLPLNPDPVRLGQRLDGIITRRNSSVHFKDLQGLQQGVQEVQGLLARHPNLRKRCQDEVIVIDSFAELQSAFQM